MAAQTTYYCKHAIVRKDGRVHCREKRWQGKTYSLAHVVRNQDKMLAKCMEHIGCFELGEE